MKKNISRKISKVSIILVAFLMLTMVFTLYQTSVNSFVTDVATTLDIDESLILGYIPFSAEAASISSFGSMQLVDGYEMSNTWGSVVEKSETYTFSGTLSNDAYKRAAYGAGAITFKSYFTITQSGNHSSSWYVTASGGASNASTAYAYISSGTHTSAAVNLPGGTTTFTGYLNLRTQGKAFSQQTARAENCGVTLVKGDTTAPSINTASGARNISSAYWQTSTSVTISDTGAGINTIRVVYTNLSGTSNSSTGLDYTASGTGESNRITSKALTLNQGQGKYVITVTDNVGNSASKTVWYYDSEVSVSPSNTEYGLAAISTSSSDYSNNTSSSDSAYIYDRMGSDTYYIFAVSNPGYYFTGWTGTAGLTSTLGVGTYYTAYNNSGIWRYTQSIPASPGAYKYSWRANFTSLATTLKSNGSAVAAGTTSFTYNYTGQPASFGVGTLPTNHTMCITYSGTTLAGNNYSSGDASTFTSGEAPTYAGSYTAYVYLRYNGYAIGYGSYSLNIKSLELKMKPVFGSYGAGGLANSKVYDGSNLAKQANATDWTYGSDLDASIQALAVDDNLIFTTVDSSKFTYNNKNVGLDKAITVGTTANITSSEGNDTAMCYTFALSSDAITGAITPKWLTLSAAGYGSANGTTAVQTPLTGYIGGSAITGTIYGKTYNGSTDASLYGVRIEGFIEGDNIGINNGADYTTITDGIIYTTIVASFANVHASTSIDNSKSVTSKELTLAGTDKGNYYLTNITTSSTNTPSVQYAGEKFTVTLEGCYIAQKQVTIRIIRNSNTNKIYDGTTSANVSFEFTEPGAIQSVGNIPDSLYIDPTGATIGFTNGDANYFAGTADYPPSGYTSNFIGELKTITATGVNISVTDPDNPEAEPNTYLSNYYLTSTTAEPLVSAAYSEDNYNNGSFIAISTRLLTPVLTAEGKTYDGTTTATTYATSDVLEGDKDGVTISYSASFDSAAVGDRTATATNLSISGERASNYHLAVSSLTANKVVISQKPINDVIIAAVADMPYVASPYYPEPQVTDGDIGGGVILTEGTDFTYTYSADTTNVGTITIYINGTGNYTSQASKTANIIKANVIISDVQNISVVYGERVEISNIVATTTNASQASVAVLGNWRFVDEVSGVPKVAETGEKIIQFTPADSSNYNTPGSVTLTLSVAKRPIIITATEQSMIYGDTIVFANTAYSTEAFNENDKRGLISGDTFGTLDCVITSKKYSADQSDETTLMAGEYAINGANIANPNYDIEFIGATYIVNRRPITIQATGGSKIYGDEDPTLGYRVSSGSFTDMPLLGELSRAEGENVGSYLTKNGTLVQSDNEGFFNTINYVIIINHANFQITRREVTVTPDSATNYFGEDIIIDEDAFSVEGVAERDKATPLAELFEITIVRTYKGLGEDVSKDNAATQAGVYDLLIKTESTAANPNYTINAVRGTYTILPRPILVTPTSNQSRIYDGTATTPNLSYTTEANLAGLSSVGAISSYGLSGSLARAEGENVGTYLISQGTLSNENGANPNYLITFSATPVYYEITKLSVDVTPDFKAINFGTELPANDSLTFSMVAATGNDVIFDALKGVKGGLRLPNGELYEGEVTPYDVGYYNVLPDEMMSNTTLNANYSIVVKGGSMFQICKLTAIIKPAADQGITFGEKVTFGTASGNLNLAYSAYDKLTGEDIDPTIIGEEFSGALAVQGYAEANTEYLIPAGSYNIVVGSLSGGENYTIEVENGATFTVSKKAITIVVEGGDNLTMIYGNTEQDIAFGIDEATPLVEGYPLSAGTKLQRANKATSSTVGTYAVGLGDLENNANYSFSFKEEYLFTINPRPIKVIPDNGISSVYGNPDSSITYTTAYYYDENESGTLEGTVGGDTLGGALARATGGDVGQYAINIGSLNNPDANGYNKNYTVILQEEIVYYSVTRRPVTVTARNVEQIFGEQEKAMTVTYSAGGLTNGLTALNGYPERDAGEAIGSYVINQGTMTNLENPNYDVTFRTATYTITKRPVTLTANAGQQKGYSEADPVFTYTVKGGTGTTGDGFVSGYEPGIILTRDEGEAPGSYSFKFAEEEGNSNNSYYTITFVAKEKFTINRGQARIAFSDGTTYNEATGRYELTLSYNGEEQTVAAYLAVGDETVNLTYRVNNKAGSTFKNAGKYSVTVTASSSAMFNGTNVGVDVTVTPYDLGTVSPSDYIGASDLVKVYGDEDATDFTFTIDGLGGDVITATMLREEGEDAGKYDLESIKLDNSNYQVSFLEGSNEDVYEIKQREITLSPALKTKVYGNAESELREIVTDDKGNTVVVTYTREEGENAGKYDLVSFTLSSTNHVASWAEDAGTDKFEILKRDVTVTANGVSKVFNGVAVDLASLTYTATNLAEGETLEGSLTIEGGAPINAGTYNIVRVALDNESNPNYNIEYVGATCYIAPAPIVITPVGAEYEYGDTIAPFGYNVSGNVYEGYPLEGELGTLKNTSIGDHSIPQGTLNNADGRNANYSITYAGVGIYCTITARHITIKAENATQVYGDQTAQIAFTVTEGSLVEGDVLEGNLAATGYKVGSYDITIGNVQELNFNYLITLDSEGAIYTITPRPVTVKAEAQSVQYGDEAALLTYTAEGLIEGDVLEGELACSIGKNIGEYAITLGTVAHECYTVSYEGATYTVTPRAIEITIANAESDFGAEEASLTYSITKGSLVEGDDLGVALQKAAGDEMGTYEITGTYDNENYLVSFVNGTYTIKKYQAVIEVETQFIAFVEDGKARIIAATCSSGAEITYTINGDEVNNYFKEAGKYVVELNAPETGNYYAPEAVTVYITVNRPTITTEANGIDVVLSADGGFDPNLSIEMEKLPIDYMDIVAELNTKQKIVRAFTLTSINESGIVDEVEGKTTVTIRVPTMLAEEKVVQVMVREDGVYNLIEVDVEDGYVTLEVDSLSSFAFITEESNNYLLLIIIGVAALIMLGSVLVFLFRKRA